MSGVRIIAKGDNLEAVGEWEEVGQGCSMMSGSLGQSVLKVLSTGSIERFDLYPA